MQLVCPNPYCNHLFLAKGQGPTLGDYMKSRVCPICGGAWANPLKEVLQRANSVRWIHNLRGRDVSKIVIHHGS
jgi:hypothetical protein